MITYEQNLWNKGIDYVAGVDEVGRGALAGPFVAAAVILSKDKLLNFLSDKNKNYTNNDVEEEAAKLYGEINDSKRLSSAKREKLAQFIKTHAIDFRIEVIDNTNVDEWGISRSTQIAFYNCVTKMRIKPQHVLTDTFALRGWKETLQTNIKKGDSLSITIAAASIVAKVYRDDLMCNLSEKYTKYRFDKHKGYGTKTHLEMLTNFGPCEIHRKSFEPIKNLLK